jgi:putative ABC transport system substrate-binding protein
MKKAAVPSILVAVVLLAVGVIADAQQPKKVPRIGFLGGASPAALSALVKAFQQGLRELGHVEGKDIVIEWRQAEEGKLDRLSELAAELVRLKETSSSRVVRQTPVLPRTRLLRFPLSWPRIAILLATDLSPALRGPAATSRGCPECPPSWRENDWSF